MGLACVAKTAEIPEIPKATTKGSIRGSTKGPAKRPEAAGMIEFGLLRDQEIL